MHEDEVEVEGRRTRLVLGKFVSGRWFLGKPLNSLYELDQSPGNGEVGQELGGIGNRAIGEL